MQLCFSGCQLDPRSRQLLRGDQPVHLTPKAYELLSVLIANRPRAVSKAELVQRVWPNSFVSDSSLARTVRELRSVLGDDAHEPRIIRTLHSFGYAFAGAVDELPSPAEDRHGATADCYWIICGSRDFALTEGENLIGRDDSVSVPLRSPDISRRHARIVIADGHATLEDLGSRNGTYLRGAKLASPTALDNGDQITLASFRLTYRVLRASDLTETLA